jgi:hypothetical protein
MLIIYTKLIQKWELDGLEDSVSEGEEIAMKKHYKSRTVISYKEMPESS